MELKLIEFKAETYNGLLRLLRPGCRTMILILDKETKDSLGAKFFKAMWPYRRNKTLNFGYMFIGKSHALKKYDQFALNTSCFYPQLCNFTKFLLQKNNE